MIIMFVKFLLIFKLSGSFFSQLLISFRCDHLKSVEFVVDALLGKELGVSAQLSHLPSTDDSNTVRTVDGRETVSDHNGGPSLPGLVQCLLNHLLTLCVQGRGGLIKEKDFGISDQCSSNGYPLLLSSTQLSALCSNVGVVALNRDKTHKLLNLHIIK